MAADLHPGSHEQTMADNAGITTGYCPGAAWYVIRHLAREKCDPLGSAAVSVYSIIPTDNQYRGVEVW